MHINIGKHSLKNRIIFPAIHTNYANTDGTVSDKLLDFYAAIADGGCGLIFTGAAVVSSYSVAFDRVREMTMDDIVRVRNDFIHAAVRAKDAGAKMVEVHAAHGYLLNEFLSPYSNHRTDEYGGTPKARARLIVEIIKGIRNRLGDNVAISVRVSGNEFVQGGLVPQDFMEIIPMFEDAGMDMLNVSAGVAESSDKIMPLESTGRMPLVGIASELKLFANVPVCAVGSILSLEAAECIISSGHADLVAMGRAQVADPSIVAKSAAGQANDVNRCAFWASGDPQMCCTINSILCDNQSVN